MHDQVRETLKRSLNEVLRSSSGVSDESEPYLVWKRSDTGGWTGHHESRPSRFCRARDSVDWETHASRLSEALKAYHSDYCGCIGCSALGSWGFNPEWYLRFMAGTLSSRYVGTSVPDQAVDEMVEDFARIIDSTNVEFDLIAPLVNFRADESIDRIDLPYGMCIHRLTEDEVTDLYGGYALNLSGGYERPGIDEFAIVGIFEDVKTVGECHDTEVFDQLVRRLDRIILALRTFQRGPVGYNRIRFCPRRLFALGITTRTFGHEYIPFGSYHVAATDCTTFRKHVDEICADLHPTIEMACSRLSDAEIRVKASDRILDAVIGMEAVLLAETAEKYRGELRYRFSLNYATLFDTPQQRMRAFCCARDLYDLRSKVAHAGRLSGNRFRLGDEQLGESEAAKKSCDILRFVLQRFLPCGEHPPYLAEGYWTNRLFQS